MSNLAAGTSYGTEMGSSSGGGIHYQKSPNVPMSQSSRQRQCPFCRSASEFGDHDLCVATVKVRETIREEAALYLVHEQAVWELWAQLRSLPGITPDTAERAAFLVLGMGWRPHYGPYLTDGDR